MRWCRSRCVVGAAAVALVGVTGRQAWVAPVVLLEVAARGRSTQVLAGLLALPRSSLLGSTGHNLSRAGRPRTAGRMGTAGREGTEARPRSGHGRGSKGASWSRVWCSSATLPSALRPTI
jgi:hypothetical protein